MTFRRIATLWRRARRAGRDLDFAGYAAFAVGALMLVATGIVGPSLDAQQHRHVDAERHAAR
ncbi:hypothetical protein M5J07_21025 [Achromobacter mucicolens]|uniref:hypothetical protein n=1 Tax=Achromobacter mucicolens TaxID=1389922 RepID=UPI0020A32419|nr:hypothetical protein [Achromobacter mucicolens]MCP2517435.1 hypothetical protein [Achromobacter mucicolens]